MVVKMDSGMEEDSTSNTRLRIGVPNLLLCIVSSSCVRLERNNRLLFEIVVCREHTALIVAVKKTIKREVKDMYLIAQSRSFPATTHQQEPN